MPEASLSVEIAFPLSFPHVIPHRSRPQGAMLSASVVQPHGLIGSVLGQLSRRHGNSFPRRDRSSLLSLHSSSVFAVSAETWDLESCNAARLHIASGGSPGSTMDRSLGSNKAHPPVLPVSEWSPCVVENMGKGLGHWWADNKTSHRPVCGVG